MKTLLSKARKRSRSEIRFQSEARPQEDERKRSLIGEPFIYDDDKINWNRWINESPQNEETESLQLIINNKLKIKKRNEWLPSCEVV